MQDAIEFHRRLAGEWEYQYQKPAFRARMRAFEECLAGCDLRQQQWLDAGCGVGTLARYLFDEGCHVLGVDGAEEMIAKARELSVDRSNQERLRFEHIQTIADLPLSDGSMDGILCSSVIEYVSDPSACLVEFARVLRRGGMLVVSVPNRYSVIRQLRGASYALGRLLNRRWFEFLRYSRNEYSAGAFRALLQGAGFSTQKVIAFDNPMPHVSFAKPVGGTLLAFRAVRD